MANNNDSEEYMLFSGARNGLKREFAFALKVQSELAGSLGRTRARKFQSSHSSNGVSENSSSKRLKSSAAKEEFKKNVVIEEVQTDTVKSSSVEEPNRDVAKSTIGEDPMNVSLRSPAPKEAKSDCMKSENEEELTKNLANTDTKPTEGEDPMSSIVKSPTTEEIKSDWMKSPIGEQLANNSAKNGAKSPKEGETGTETPIVIDDVREVRNALVEKTYKRFTRSALKPKSAPMEMSSTATSSGGSAVSEVACKNEAPVQDEGITTNAVSPLRTPPKNNLEMKMSKKIALTKFPSTLKELLETGMLEGLPVNYIFRGKKKGGLRGTIKDRGILCSCASCKGFQLFTPYQFEKHAGSSNKHPSENIYLENGNSLREVLNACKDAPLETLEAAIQRAICSSSERKFTICQICKGPLPPSCATKTALLCNSCLESKKSLASPVCMDGTNALARLSRPILTPRADSVSEFVSPQNKSSQGRLTRKDLRLHKLVFEEDGLPDGTELAYYIRGQKLLEGYKKGFGIFCHCCNSEVSPSQFEAHAGWASRRKPYLNIYTSNGVSLHELSVSLSRGRKLSVSDNDDLCSICADFGDLLLCDGCPRAFHQDCVGLSTIPHGKWYCQYCLNMYQREKSCEYNANAKAAGRVSGVDPIEQISKRCIRIVRTPETEVGGCVLCRCHGFSKSGFGPRTVILCDQCEKEFHVGCLKDHEMADLKELPKGEWFCCTDCSRIHTVLQKLLIRGSEKLPDSLSSVIKKKHEDKGSNNNAVIDVRWSLLSGKSTSPESRSLLSKAVAIFHDRFDPIVDSKTGRDLIPSMVYGRNIRDQEFGGMYCAVLTVNSSVVSAGILRIFGVEIAELPLVATCSDNQGKGYFQSLFACIERLLGFLNVRSLVLPSAEEAESIWTDKFGFKKITQDQLSEYRKNYQMMTFQGTSMLQKPVPKCRIVDKSTDES